MIAKPEWFSPRKFGWGLGLKTKEGILYFAAAIVIILGIAALPVDEGLKGVGFAIVVGVLLVDLLSVIPKVYSSLDEREQMHQLVAERNASFTAIVCLVGFMLYQVYIKEAEHAPINPDAIVFPAIILVAMALAKGLTLFKLEREV